MKPTIDAELYSEAGFVWDEAARKWRALPGAASGRKGLSVVGSAAYMEHPSTEILTLSYDLCDGLGVRRWRPGQPLPADLIAYLAAGGTIEAHNSLFDWMAWNVVGVAKHGLPPFPLHQMRCSMATARVNNFPGSLDKLGDVLGLDTKKDADGKRLIKKFCIPRDPTKSDPRTRIRPEDDPADFERLCEYCDQDVRTEQAASSHPLMKPMPEMELGFWLIDQEMNWRGLGVDREGVRNCIAVLNQAIVKYGAECRALTGGIEPTQLQQLKGWLAAHGVYADSLDAEALDGLLAMPSLPAPARRALEIRALVGSASVKKLFAMENQCCNDNRLRNLITHHGARTGRPTGDGPQPLNLPKAGPKLAVCPSCGKPGLHGPTCRWCLDVMPANLKTAWKADMVPVVLEVMAARSLEAIEYFFGDALLAISGCIRGLFVADEGNELIASDYSAIEAVVTAMLAGEEWRIQAFREKAPIYLVGASKITGRSVLEYLDYYEANGEHHPDRQNIGKVSELACGFGGWIGAYKAFGSKEADSVIKQQILAWRAASPAIVEMWGGQWRGTPWDGYAELYGYEGCAIAAIRNPGRVYEYRGIRFHVETVRVDVGERTTIHGMHDRMVDKLVVTLLSGRELVYHEPLLTASTREWASPGEVSISYMTWNSNPKYGPMGWVRMSTFGGRLTENIVQAVAHDLQRYSIIMLRLAQYPIVLGVYDENVCEVPKGRAKIDEYEMIMAAPPHWAEGWPIEAAGGWIQQRYKKG